MQGSADLSYAAASQALTMSQVQYRQQELELVSSASPCQQGLLTACLLMAGLKELWHEVQYLAPAWLQGRCGLQPLHSLVFLATDCCLEHGLGLSM